jgi:hypothetical protein
MRRAGDATGALPVRGWIFDLDGAWVVYAAWVLDEAV